MIYSYLHQSRRCAKILKNKFEIKFSWTNYTAWEYLLLNNEMLEITYTNERKINRFNIYTHYPTYRLILSTNSIKEVNSYLELMYNKESLTECDYYNGDESDNFLQ